MKITQDYQLPDRTLNTLSDAIAVGSPSGHMSKHSKDVADERLRRALFGDGLPYPTCQQPTARTALLAQAARLRALASKGMKPKAYTKEAERLEAEAGGTDGRH